ncbi:hypothetical protein NECAME_07879 [Necator americanus]|uniref:Uncharacterized protein n=1 Tax=Necator americanus TaxID=51031 RepID=W2TNK0_NECAM|nr:hypothetical protein NECAME_07879 [Necator americanus]ETN82587.1 hypothetical protein NECAME_07879 [Necator americanus]
MQQKSPIVLIVAGEESELIVRALSEVFCAAFHISSSVLVIDLTSESVREKLHEGLDRAVHSTVPLAILNGVDHLGWDSPLILHAFADDSSLTTSRALLLLTMKKNFHVSKEQCEKSVMEYLSAKWINGGGSADNVFPILSRIMQFLICL